MTLHLDQVFIKTPVYLLNARHLALARADPGTDRLKDYVGAGVYKIIHGCVSLLVFLVEVSSCFVQCGGSMCLADIPWPGGAAAPVPGVILPSEEGGKNPAFSHRCSTAAHRLLRLMVVAG